MYLQEIGNGAWENVKNIFSNIAKGLGNIFKSPINFIIGIINGFIGGLNKIKIPDWVPGIGGFGINIPQIPKLKVGMDYVPEDNFPAILHEGEAVLTKEENREYRQNKSKEDKKDDEEKKTVIYEGDLIVNIDKFYNETDNDVEAFGEQLAFVYKKKNRRKGEK